MNEKLELFIPGHASIKYVIYDVKIDRRNQPMIVQDAGCFTNEKIIYITQFTSTIKGSGKILLNYFCEFFCNYAIVLKAEPLYEIYDEYYADYKSGKLAKSIAKLNKYYESCNFINVNFYVEYQYSTGFLFNNDIGKEIYEGMKEVCP